MASKGAEIGQLPGRAPDLGDMTSRHGVTLSKVDSEANSTLNHAELSRLDKEHTHLGLHSENSELWSDEKVSIRITVRLIVHILIEHVDVKGDPLLEVGVTTTAKSVQAISKVYPFSVLG